MKVKSVLTLLMCVSSGCSRESPVAGPVADSSSVVATIGTRRLTRAEVEAQLATQPDFLRARYTNAAARKDFVEQLVRTELLVQEASRRGIDKRPETKALIEKVVIQQLVSELTKASQPTEADARAYFDSHPEEFSRPERVRVAIVEFGAMAAKSAPDRGAVELEVKRLRAAPVAERTRLFTLLVQARSTDPSKSQDGDIGPRTKQELAQQFSVEVADAAFALSVIGDVALASSTRGLVALRLIARQPEERRAFETEKSALLARLAAERRLGAVEELVKELRRKTPVENNDGVVEALTNEVTKQP